MTLKPEIIFKFNYNDKVLNRKIKYAEIKLPPKNIKIRNISFPFKYIYDAPINKINNPKYYKLPFKHPNINFINMYKEYNYTKKQRKLLLDEYNYIMNSIQINKIENSWKECKRILTNSSNKDELHLNPLHYNEFFRKFSVNKNNKEVLNITYKKIKYNNKNNMNKNRDIFQQYMKSVKK